MDIGRGRKTIRETQRSNTTSSSSRSALLLADCFPFLNILDLTHHHGGGGGGANSPHNPGGGANAMATPPNHHGGAIGGAPALLAGLVGGAASGANASGAAPLADLHNHHVHDLMSCVGGSYHSSSSGAVMVGGGADGRSPSPARMAYTSEKHPRATFSELNAIRKHHDLCDVVIVVGSRKIFAHKVILAACSPYFRAPCLREN